MSVSGGEERVVMLPRAESILSEATLLRTHTDYRAFGVEPDNFGRHLVMLEVRLRTESRLLFAYHLLGRVEWDPSREMALFFGEKIVVLKGRNLLSLFSALREQKVAWVAEASRAAAELAAADATVVESIAVEPRMGVV